MAKEVSIDRVMEICENDEDIGICRSCGHEQDGCEPDARQYECEECGERQVYGAQELLIMLG